MSIVSTAPTAQEMNLDDALHHAEKITTELAQGETHLPYEEAVPLIELFAHSIKTGGMTHQSPIVHQALKQAIEADAELKDSESSVGYLDTLFIEAFQMQLGRVGTEAAYLQLLDWGITPSVNAQRAYPLPTEKYGTSPSLDPTNAIAAVIIFNKLQRAA
ncbi:MAG: hypothetical protein AB7G80_00135 [Dongiaceae bacterium]